MSVKVDTYKGIDINFEAWQEAFTYKGADRTFETLTKAKAAIDTESKKKWSPVMAISVNTDGFKRFKITSVTSDGEFRIGATILRSHSDEPYHDAPNETFTDLLRLITESNAAAKAVKTEVRRLKADVLRPVEKRDVERGSQV